MPADEDVKRVTMDGDDEVDLYEIYLVIRKRIWLVIGIFLLATMVAGIAAFSMPRVYEVVVLIKMPAKVEMSQSSQAKLPDDHQLIVSNQETKQILAHLTMLIKERRMADLAFNLRLHRDEVEKLVAIEFKPLKDQQDAAQIIIQTTAPQLITKYEKAIMNYLNLNGFVLERLTLQQDELKKMKGYLEKNLVASEKVRTTLLRAIESNNIQNLGFNPLEIGKEIVALKGRLDAVTDQIQLARGFEVIVEPVVPQQPIKPKKGMIIVLAGVTALFTGVFLAFFLEWLEKAKRR